MRLDGAGGTSRRRRAAMWLAIVCIAPAIAGCTQARLVDVWRDPEYRGGPVRSLLVVSQQQDDIRRRLWEDALTQEITDRGVSVTPSYRDDPQGPPSRSQLSDALRADGIEAALIVRPLPSERDARWVPGWTSYEPRTRYDPWRDGRVTVLRPRVHPGYTVVDRIARAQVTVWTSGDEPRMVWAATVETVNPSTGDELRKDIASGLVPALIRAGVLPPPRTGRASRS